MQQATKSVLIPLTQGQTALVDAFDTSLICQHKWHACRRGNTFYAATRINCKTVLMHAMILGEKQGYVRDHINGNGLDNRRENLRFALHSDNMANRKRSVLNKSGYKGVHKTPHGAYVVALRKGGDYHYVGYFTDLIAAALAYDAKAKELHGEFAKLNFGVSQ